MHVNIRCDFLLARDGTWKLVWVNTRRSEWVNKPNDGIKIFAKSRLKQLVTKMGEKFYSSKNFWRILGLVSSVDLISTSQFVYLARIVAKEAYVVLNISVLDRYKFKFFRPLMKILGLLGKLAEDLYSTLFWRSVYLSGVKSGDFQWKERRW